MDNGDMDVDMDIDLGPLEASDNVQPQPTQENVHANGNSIASVAEATLDPESSTPHKVHLRGVDDLTTNDIESFAIEHYPATPPVRIEWIDDTSVNIVFDTPATGMAALESFALQHSPSTRILQLQAAKRLSSHPESSLFVRTAVVTDQKRARAHEASRFYMMHPEHDPRERRRRDRRPHDGGYQKRRYSEDENRRRRRRDRAEGLNASMYDDNSSTSRRGSVVSSSDERSRRRTDYRPDSDEYRTRSASPGAETERRRKRTPPPRYRSRDPFPYPVENQGKELFPSKTQEDGDGAGKDLFSSKIAAAQPKKELFPLKANNVIHRRSDAFDAADDTVDTFGGRAGLPRNDQSTGKSLADRITLPENSFRRLSVSDSYPEAATQMDMEDKGVSILGAAADQGVSIRGAASTNGPSIGKIRELFPDKANGNAGKELFAERLQGRGGRRNRAEDMFS